MPFSSLTDLLQQPQRRLAVPRTLELPEPAAFLQRAASISLIVFRGPIEAAVHAWLGKHGWRLLESAPLRASFDELTARATHTRKVDAKQWEVLKATYEVAGHTVLLDAEMVVLANEAGLAELCQSTESSAIGGIWERVSGSLVITELTPAGVIHRSSWQGGERGEELDPWPHVTGTGPGDIIETFRASGLPVDAIFGRDLAATVLLLAE